MPDFYFSVSISNDRMLCISPLSDQEAEDAGDAVGDDPLGYFLYERNLSDKSCPPLVIAKVVSEDAAFTLGRILGMS